MKTSRLFVVSVIAMALATALFGEEKGLSVELSTKVMSKDIDDDGIALYGGTNLATELTVSGGHGFYLSFRSVRGLSGHRSALEYQDQLESYFGWAGEVGGLAIDISGGYYDLSPIMKDTRNAIRSFAVELRPSGEHSFTPFASFESYHMRSDADFEGGTRTRLGVEFSYKVGRASIEQSLVGVYEDGAFGYGKAFVGIYNADIVWSVGKVKLILPSLALYYPFEKHDGQKTEFVVGAGARWSF
jgi:hypothetical protein